MPKTYTIASADDRSQVRLQIGDTQESTAFFTDAEVDAAITRGGSVAEGAAILLRVLAAGAVRRGDPASAAEFRALADSMDPSTVSIKVGIFAATPYEDGYEEIDNG